MLDKMKSNSRVNIEGIVLKTIAVAGLMTVAICAPNALKLLKQFDFNKKRKKNPKYLINEAVGRLIRKNLVKIDRDGKLSLSKAGIERLYFLEEGKLAKKKQKWDGKWRMVIFDINEKRKKSREHLRYLLNKIGFVRLQDSVWVYPYEAEEIISLIKVDNFLQKEVLYLMIEKVGNDDNLRKHFRL